MLQNIQVVVGKSKELEILKLPKLQVHRSKLFLWREKLPKIKNRNWLYMELTAGYVPKIRMAMTPTRLKAKQAEPTVFSGFGNYTNSGQHR